MDVFVNKLGNMLEFSNVLNASIAASWLVIAVLFLRFVFKRAPKWIHVAMWGVVAFRLLCPFSIESAVSLIPSAETIPRELMRYEGEALKEPMHLTVVTNPVVLEPVVVELTQSVDSMQIKVMYMNLVWWSGMVVMLLYTAISYGLLWQKVRTAVRYRKNIFQSEYIKEPFVLGIIKPKIFIPFQIAKEDMLYVIAHEQMHICRKDHWWKPLGFLLLTFHWFNPFMWLAYVLLCRDIELACDEKVIKRLGHEQRADYSRALLMCSVNRKILAACPLAFGEVGVKERVKNILNYRKPGFLLVLAAVLAGMVLAVCFLTDPITDTVEAKEGENGFVSLGYQNYNDGYSDFYIATFTVALGEEMTDGKIYIEQWYNGECVSGVPGILSADTTELNIRMRSSMDGANGEITIWTDEFAGEWTTTMQIPEAMVGWHYETHEEGSEIIMESEDDVILALMTFDNGKGMPNDVLKSPQKLKEEMGYTVVVRAVFGDGEASEMQIEELETETMSEQNALHSRLDLKEVITVEDKEMKAAYIRALEKIVYECISPDGQQWAPTGETKFAIYDIDSDGSEELLIYHDDGYMAGMGFFIYDYDRKKDTLRLELQEFPSLTFYEDGTVEARASHNHGMAPGYVDENFWPYTLYRYNVKTDTYERLLNVDAWEKAYNETAWTGETFQEKADIDGDGVLYYIMTDGEYNYDEPIDGKEYRKWRASMLGEVLEMDIPFIVLPYVLPEAAA